MSQSQAAGEALIRYGDGDYDVIRPGRFVVCAVTRKAIPLEGLRYWSVSRQEAYAGPLEASQRLSGKPGS